MPVRTGQRNIRGSARNQRGGPRRSSAGGGGGGGGGPPAVAWAHSYHAAGPRFVALGLADSAQVANWPDEIGSSNPAQATAGKRPLYKASVAALNGKPAIKFDGTDDQLGPAAFTSIAVPSAIVLIIDVVAVAVYGIFDADTPTQRTVEIRSGPVWTHAVGLGASGGVPTTGKHAIRSSNPVGSVDALNVDGVTLTTTTIGDGTVAAVTLGAFYYGSQFFNGHIAFCGIYAGDVTADAQWTAFKAWALTEYGVTLG